MNTAAKIRSLRRQASELRDKGENKVAAKLEAEADRLERQEE